MFIKEFDTIDGKDGILFYVNYPGPIDNNLVGFIDLSCKIPKVGEKTVAIIHWLRDVELVDIKFETSNHEDILLGTYINKDKHYAELKFIMPESSVQIGLFIK